MAAPYLLTVHVSDPVTGATQAARFQFDATLFDLPAWDRAFPDVSVLVQAMLVDPSGIPAKPL